MLLSRHRKILRIIAFIIGGSILLLAILLLAFRIALARAPQYRLQVQGWVSERTGLDIQFSRMDARWRFYGPELVFDAAIVRSRDGKRTLVSAQRVSLGFDVWTAVSTQRLVAGRLILEKPELQVIRKLDGKFEIVGQSDLPERNPNTPFELDAMPVGSVQVVKARVSFRDLKTGRGPWIVPGVSFDLKRSGRAMQLRGEAGLPKKLGKSLRFSAQTAGRFAEAQELRWQFAVAGRDLDLAGWTELSPKDFPAPRRGLGSFELAGIFQGTEVSELVAKVQFNNVQLFLPAWLTAIPEPAKLEAYIDPDEESLLESDASIEARAMRVTDVTASALMDYERIAFDLKLTQIRSEQSNEWHVRVKDLELPRPNVPWRRSTLSADIMRSSTGQLTTTLQADLLVLQNLWPLLAYGPESKSLAHLRAMNAQGHITGFKADFVRSATEASPTYSIHTRFADFGIDAIGKAPGVSNLTGLIEGTQASGFVNLDIRDGTFDLPRYFRTSLPADRVVGKAQWRRDATGWHIEAKDLQIDTVDGHARASGTVLVPHNGDSLEVNLHATGRDLVVRSAPRYMPANKLSRKSLEWLDRAFVMGTVAQAEFVMRGPVRAFPFRRDEGLFLIKARINGLTLDYMPSWLPATNLVVDAEFKNIGMSATVLQGEINGMQITAATGKIQDFKRSELVLDAEVAGDLAQSLPFVQQSPIGPAVGAQFMALNAEGAMQGQVKLRLPFKNVEQRKLIVTTKISGGKVSSKSLTQAVTDLKGQLRVENHALHSLELQGKFLDGPVTIKGGVEGRYTGRGAGLQITAQGRARGSSLAEFLHLPNSIPLSGAMQWQFTAVSPRHAPDNQAKPIYIVESDTKGLGLGLPAPLGKSPESVRNLHFEVDATRDGQLLLRGAFGTARTVIRLQHNDEGWHLDRGGIRVDAVAAGLPAHKGLRIEGTLDRFVLDEWLKLKSDQPGKHQLSDYLRAANVRLNSFGFFGHNWQDVRAILQATDNSWRIDVAGEDIAGQLSIPYKLDTGAPLQVALTKLNIDADTNSSKNSNEALEVKSDPRDMPAITGRVDELTLAGRYLGVARFNLNKVPQGVKLTNGELRGDSFAVTARGTWLMNTTGTAQSSLELDVTSSDVRDTLRAFKFHDVISAKRASAHAALTWPGDIDEDLLGRASGSVHIELHEGQILNIEPGAGRVLGLLSIAALPRRLSLNFKDVTDKGFSFDTVRGDFELKDGDAFTNNLLMRGPAAEVGIVGRTGLGKHDYDQTAVVAGDIGGSLSVAGAVVGGPVLGAAVLAFTRLFKEPLKGVTRRYHRITGPWENPLIERIDAQEAKQNSADADIAVSELEESAEKTPVMSDSPNQTSSP